jgi:hypothetical protein
MWQRKRVLKALETMMYPDGVFSTGSSFLGRSYQHFVLIYSTIYSLILSRLVVYDIAKQFCTRRSMPYNLKHVELSSKFPFFFWLLNEIGKSII